MASTTIGQTSFDLPQSTETVLLLSTSSHDLHTQLQPFATSKITSTVDITTTANQSSVETFTGIAVGVFAVLLGTVFIVLVVGVVVRKRKIPHNSPPPQELIRKENPSYGMVAIHSTDATTEIGVNPAYGASGKTQLIN